MTHTRAGVMTRKTRKGVGVVGIPHVAGRMIGYGWGIVLRYNWSALTDVLKRPNLYSRDLFYPLSAVYECNQEIVNPFPLFPKPRIQHGIKDENDTETETPTVGKKPAAYSR